jgi:alginate O-acetyltransferase complex protein AlgJ
LIALIVRRSVFHFLSIVLLSIFVIPIFNILSAPSRDAIKWTEKSFLYNIDFASKWTALFLYPFGISTDPKKVIVGRDGWLFLGDQYAQILTDGRRPPSEADLVLGQEIGRAVAAWDAYLSSKGVKLFRVMIGPNKGTIYPEYLPRWAKPTSPNPTDALLAGTGTTHYLDLREALLAAKTNNSAPLYYKTDTHWNSLGGGIAFQAFAHQLTKAAPEIQWPSQSSYELDRIDPRHGGDLANFLRLTTHLSDSEPIILASNLSVETTQIDFDTKQIVRKGGNPTVGSPFKPLLIQSEGALNKKKVLWLRDSFGTALSPWMAITFSEVLQFHWPEAIRQGGRFVQLVEEWKPDYVFFTVVERDSKSPAFAAPPPPVIISREVGFKPVRTASAIASNHLLQGHSDREFQINGNDPFIDFALSNMVDPAEVRYLSIDLVCEDGSPSVPLQLFWLEDGRPYFDEEHSSKLSFRTGRNLIDLRTIPKWGAATTVSRIRLDIDSLNSCANFKLGNPSFGSNNAGS